ncbi:MAG: MYG1 family protein [Waddliaceae bacterium]
MTGEKISRSFGTHDGSFHADEVTACALLLLFDLIDEDKIIRTRNRDMLAQCEYVCDVGGVYDPNRKLFDHHQAGYNGELSSAGMALLYLKECGVLNLREYQHFHDSLVRGVDDHDNGRPPQIPGLCTYSHVIGNFSPIFYDSPDDQRERAFFEALTFSKGHLQRLWKRYQYMQSCKEIVKTAMEQNNECLMFSRGIPWIELFFELGGEDHSARFVIMPSGQHWTLRGIPPNLGDRMSVRLPLPSEWAGLLDEELREVSGILGAVFCHKGRFISVWESRDEALKALNYTLSLPISNESLRELDC